MPLTRSRSNSDHKRRKSFRRFAVLCTVFASQIMQVMACDVCLRLPGVPFESEHPDAVEVALATRMAADQGEIDLDPVVNEALANDRQRQPRLGEISPKHLATLWSQTRPAKNRMALRFTMDIIFVDMDRMCRFDVRFGEVIDGDPKSSPADVRLITTKAGFLRLLEDGVEHCEKRKLISIQSDEAQFREGLISLFSNQMLLLSKS